MQKKDNKVYSHPRSIQPVWDELMKDELISGLMRKSLISSGMMKEKPPKGSVEKK
jgi:hypothetical protein